MTYYDVHPALTCTTTQNKLSSFALQSGSFARVPLWQGSPGDRYELRSQPQRLPMISWAWQPTTGLGLVRKGAKSGAVHSLTAFWSYLRSSMQSPQISAPQLEQIQALTNVSVAHPSGTEIDFAIGTSIDVNTHRKRRVT